MKKQKIYYHIIEDGGYGKIGTHGFFNSEEEANLKVNSLKNMFPDCFFWVFTSTSRREPEIVTL
jgi:hypothetical protein